MLAGKAVSVAGGDEFAKERVGLEGLGFEFGVELAAQEVGVAGNLHDFDVGLVGRGATDAKARAGEQSFVLAIEFVAMAVALADLCSSAVNAAGERILLQIAGPGAQSHRPAHLFHAEQFAELVDDAMLAWPGSNSLEFASLRPQTLRANSMHAVCMPRQMPK